MLEDLNLLVRQYPLQHLNVDGHRWEWLDTGGDGPCLVMLPGSAADATMFVVAIRALAGRARIVSMSVPALWQPEQLADGCAAVLAHAAVPPAVVVGSSFGAWWGPFLAQRHPQRVRGLLIGNGFVDASDLASNPLFDRALIEDTPAADLHALWASRIEASPASPLRDLQRFMLGRKPAASLHAHFVAVVRAVPCPPLSLPGERVLVLDCADDPVIPEAGRAHVRRHFAPARHVTLPTGGHYPHVLNWSAYEPELVGLLERAG